MAPGQSTQPQLTRDEFITQYRDWLSQRLVEVSALDQATQPAVTRGLLEQMEGVFAGMQRGVYPNLQTLDPSPVATNVMGSGVMYSAPPQLIHIARQLIALFERPAAGRLVGNNPEGSRDGTNVDWNTRFGVPQYRTQSDNLAGPETTCSVSSMAMILERLGYGRPDVMNAIQQHLRRKYWKEQNLKSKIEPTAAELASVVLPVDYFQTQVKSYLDKENDRPLGGKNNDSPYPRLRGTTQSAEQIASVSSEYQESAQLEDLLDFLRYLKGWGEREEFLVGSSTIINTLDPDGEDRPAMQHIPKDANTTWASVREQIAECLDAGGAAMLSFFHKGAGKDKKGSHIVTVQYVTTGGLVVDDPYGGIREDYDHSKTEDAFAPKGSATRTDTFRNKVDRAAKGAADIDDVGDDWKVEYAQQLQIDESLGDTHFVADAVFDDSWNYVRLFQRPSAVHEQNHRRSSPREDSGPAGSRPAHTP